MGGDGSVGWDIELEKLNQTRKGRPGCNFFLLST